MLHKCGGFVMRARVACVCVCQFAQKAQKSLGIGHDMQANLAARMYEIELHRASIDTKII